MRFSRNTRLVLVLAAALLAEGESVIHDVPDLADVRLTVDILGKLGMEVSRDDSGAMRLHVVDETASHAPYDSVRKMRASICVLGPLLTKRRVARVAMPGGCAIGSRPIDLHLRGLRALGAKIELDQGDIVAKADRLKGADIFLGGPFGSTVLGTANVMMAAALADGKTMIESAACEPEIKDLGDFLNAMGGKITGHGTPRVTIEGVEGLAAAEHTLIPDRMEAGTFILASAITNGEVTLENVRMDHMMALTDKLAEVGAFVEKTDPKTGEMYIVDGHHRWAALFKLSPETRISVNQVGLGIKDLLEEARDYEHAKFRSRRQVGSWC